MNEATNGAAETSRRRDNLGPLKTERPFICYVCGRTRWTAERPGPLDWYSLSRLAGDVGRRGLGYYCSAECLWAMLPIIAKMEREEGPDWYTRKNWQRAVYDESVAIAEENRAS